MKIKCYAKINLFLDITGADGGYHMLDTVVASVSVFDEIIMTKRADNKINFECNIDIPANNALTVAVNYQKKFKTSGVNIILKKNIPIGGGLGGSSADAAGVLRGMSQLFGFSNIDQLADDLGSDTKYMLEGGFARLRGRGDVVEKLPIDSQFKVLIVKPHEGLSTREVFAAFDKPSLRRSGRDCGNPEKLIKGLKENNALLIAENSYNALYKPAANLLPALKELKKGLDSIKPMATLMSGSGSAMFAIIKEDVDLKRFEKYGYAAVCETRKAGIEIEY